MKPLQTLILAESDTKDIIHAAAPLFAVRNDVMLYIDLYCGESDLFVPSIGINAVGLDEDGKPFTLYPSSMTSREQLAAGQTMLRFNALCDDLITLLEITGSQTGNVEMGYYIRLWVHPSGLVAITPEDGDGWQYRNQDFIDSHSDDVIGRVFLTNKTPSAHTKIELLPALLAFDAALWQWQTQTSWNDTLVFQSCDKAQWLVFGS